MSDILPYNQPRAELPPVKQAQSSLAHEMDARAVAALDEAHELPPGDGRTEAMNKAKILRNAVDMLGLFSGKGQAPAE